MYITELIDREKALIQNVTNYKLQRALTQINEYYSLNVQGRRWHPVLSFDWDKMRKPSDTVLQLLEGFYAVEQFAPDYTTTLVALNRRDYTLSQFYLRWGAEESLHADTWRRSLNWGGHRTATELDALDEQLRVGQWTLPYNDPLEMVFYALVQERATEIIYSNTAKIVSHDEGLEFDGPSFSRVIRRVANDEAAHYGFFLNVAIAHLHFETDRTLAALRHVLASFEMPASKLIEGYDTFIEKLYAADVFGKRKYARDVVAVVAKHLGIDFAALRKDPEGHDPHALFESTPAALFERTMERISQRVAAAGTHFRESTPLIHQSGATLLPAAE